MTGAKIEYLAKTALEAATASEYLASREPAYENKLVGGGNLKALAVGLLLCKLYLFGKIARDGVRRFNYPNSLLFIVFAPF